MNFKKYLFNRFKYTLFVDEYDNKMQEKVVNDILADYYFPKTKSLVKIVKHIERKDLKFRYDTNRHYYKELNVLYSEYILSKDFKLKNFIWTIKYKFKKLTNRVTKK